MAACLRAAKGVPGVQAVTAHSFWMLTSARNVGCVSVRVVPGTEAEGVARAVAGQLKKAGLHVVTVDAEVDGVDEAQLKTVDLGADGTGPAPPAVCGPVGVDRALADACGDGATPLMPGAGLANGSAGGGQTNSHGAG